MGTKTMTIHILVPGGRLRDSDRALADRFGFWGKRLFERQINYHGRMLKKIKKQIMAEYPDAGQISVIYCYDNQESVEIIH